MPAPRKPRKPVGSSLQAWGQGIGALHNAGIGYTPAQGYVERPKPQGGMTFSPEEIAAQQARARQRAIRSQQLTDESTGDTLNYNEQLRRYREQLPNQQRNALQSMNKAGLAQSTVHSEEQGNIATRHARGVADMQTAYNERQAAREAARRMLEQGGEIEDADATVEAATRRYSEASELAGENGLVGTAPVPQSRVAEVLAKTRSAAAAPAAPRVDPIRLRARSRPQRTTVTRRPRRRR